MSCKCDYYMAAKFDKYLTSYQRCLLLPSTDAKGEARLVEELFEKALCEKRQRIIKNLHHSVITFTLDGAIKDATSVERQRAWMRRDFGIDLA
jgi:hypothetical protein